MEGLLGTLGQKLVGGPWPALRPIQSYTSPHLALGTFSYCNVTWNLPPVTSCIPFWPQTSRDSTVWKYWVSMPDSLGSNPSSTTMHWLGNDGQITWSFHVCKMWVIIVLSHRVTKRFKWVYVCKTSIIVPGTKTELLKHWLPFLYFQISHALTSSVDSQTLRGF